MTISVSGNLSSRLLCQLCLVFFSLCPMAFATASLPLKTVQNTEESQHHYNWFKDNQTLSQAKEAIDFIAKSANHGLEPADYHYQTLVSLSNSREVQEQTQFNTLMTEALLSLSHDLRIGRWLPSTVDPDWYIPQDEFDASAFLDHALSSGAFRFHLDWLPPHTPTYQRLITSYERYLRYAQLGGWEIIPTTPKLSPGDYHPHIALIQTRLAVEDDFFALTRAILSNLYDPLMEQAVRRFQQRYGLKVDGIIGRNTLKTLNVPVETRLAQLKINLERHRWMPRKLGQRYVLINLANYRLQAFENGVERLGMNVVIGKKDRQTPSFHSQMSHIVFNPFWNVPSKLARLDLLPKQQQDPNYFFQQEIRVFTKIGNNKIELDPANINWQVHDPNIPLPYSFRQNPGRLNALGQLKFMFDNPWQIYLHDSPGKSLFDKPNRAFSSGCIRVADSVSLANFSLAGHKAYGTVIQRIESEHNHGLVLDEPLNIFAAYFTVSLSEDDVLFLPDVYQRDQRMIKKLY